MSVQLLCISLWLVFVTGLLVTLVVQLATQQGRSRPLRICMVLSLLAHVLLAGYAATVQIVGLMPAVNESVIEIVFFGELEESADATSANPRADTADETGTNPVEPSESVLTRLKPSDVDLPQRDRDAAASEEMEVSSETAADPRRERAAPRQDHAPTLSPDSRQIERRVVDALQDLPIQRDTFQTSPELIETSSATKAPPRDSTNAQSTAGNRQPPTPDDRIAEAKPDDPAKPAHERPVTEATPRVPKVYQLRFGTDRARIARQHGGSADAEAAVRRGLAWLAAAQSPDGRWDASRFDGGRELKIAGSDRHGAGISADTGMTGLALLAFLGAGQTHLDGEYKRTVRDGLQYLLDTQKGDGNLAGDARLFAAMYCHGMASFALSEAHAITRDERLRPAVERAVAYLVAAQHPTGGGWRYRRGDAGDTSQLGWQVMALRSAEVAGIPIPDRTRRSAIKFLARVSAGPNGGLACYRPGQQISRTMTAEALVCRLFLDVGASERTIDEAANHVMQQLPGQFRATGGRANLYYWYYATLALHQLQDDRWTAWNKALQTELLKSQRPESVLGSDEFAGSWDPDTVWGAYGGRIYSTALATLCLEVYYRYLPLYATRPGKTLR